MTRDLDALVGAGATGTGSLGLVVQYVTNFGSLALIALNVALALGGAYLLYLRISRARIALDRERRDRRDWARRPSDATHRARQAAAER